MLDPGTRLEVTIEPLDDFVVVQPLDDSETASGLIVPVNEAAQCATGIVVTRKSPPAQPPQPAVVVREQRLARA